MRTSKASRESKEWKARSLTLALDTLHLRGWEQESWTGRHYDMVRDLSKDAITGEGPEAMIDQI